MLRSVLWITNLGLLLLITGCNLDKGSTTVESSQGNRITKNSFLVGRRIEVTDVRMAERNGLLQPQITLQNRTKKDQQFEYRFRWLDAQGIEVPSTAHSWTPVNINPREPHFVSTMAPTPEARDFVFDVRFIQGSERWPGGN